MTEQNLKSYDKLADFAPEWVVLPGDIIAERLEELGWSQAEFATRMEFTRKHVNLLIKGNASITEETAIKLERVLGSSVRYWLNLESQCREHQAKSKARDALSGSSAWLKQLPVADMKKYGWIGKVGDKIQTVQECLSFFGVASVDAWQAQYVRPVAAYRATAQLIKSPEAVATWLRFGEREAERMRLPDFNKASFEARLHELRHLTTEPDPQVFVPKLQSVCAQSGVALVLAPAPKGCPVSGAAKWLGPRRALIMLSLRGKTDDTLWFTFFHEAAHLLKHGKSMTFMDLLGESGLDPALEKEANAFASNHLIPPADYQSFVDSGAFNEDEIKAFAKAINIAPGIVLGRLQFEGIVPWHKCNPLKKRYKWVHEG
jgi:HTH-type transcriptional regulator/antitoxin HigA